MVKRILFLMILVILLGSVYFLFFNKVNIQSEVAKNCEAGGGDWTKGKICSPSPFDCMLEYNQRNEGLNIVQCPNPDKLLEKEYCACQGSSYCWDGKNCIEYSTFEALQKKN